MGRGTAFYGPQCSYRRRLDRPTSRILPFKEVVSTDTTCWPAPNGRALARNEVATEEPRHLEEKVEDPDVGQLWFFLSEGDKRQFSSHFSRMVMKFFEDSSQMEIS